MTFLIYFIDSPSLFHWFCPSAFHLPIWFDLSLCCFRTTNLNQFESFLKLKLKSEILTKLKSIDSWLSTGRHDRFAEINPHFPWINLENPVTSTLHDTTWTGLDLHGRSWPSTWRSCGIANLRSWRDAGASLPLHWSDRPGEVWRGECMMQRRLSYASS